MFRIPAPKLDRTSLATATPVCREATAGDPVFRLNFDKQTFLTVGSFKLYLLTEVKLKIVAIGISADGGIPSAVVLFQYPYCPSDYQSRLPAYKTGQSLTQIFG
ncbi:MAG: hypothetical protein AAGC65_18420, partial [Mucilaginibacter sp.]|uniref:hypothetical protein n=1 Tax=Mucilaginibacter sp. TaxID=1882438 RepID=UPI0031ABB1E7